MRPSLRKRRRSLDAIHSPLALTRIPKPHVLQGVANAGRLRACVARVLVLLVGLGWMVGSPVQVQAQADSQSRSERKAEERRMKEAAKAEKKAMKEFEKNYKELQERHYKHQQTGREKNLIVPEGSSTRTKRRNKNHEKGNVRKRMRKGQQKARRHRDGRTVSWWQRLSVRRSWKKH